MPRKLTSQESIAAFWAKVKMPTTSKPWEADASHCWEWIAAKDPKGYGRVKRHGTAGTQLAHRLSYERVIGAIPNGLHLDHLCRNTSCVNPAHLEPVTHAENMRRSPLIRASLAKAVAVSVAQRLAATTCKHGHAFDRLRLATEARPAARVCGTCDMLAGRKHRAAKKQARHVA